jgi:hypothetical protein
MTTQSSTIHKDHSLSNDTYSEELCTWKQNCSNTLAVSKFQKQECSSADAFLKMWSDFITIFKFLSMQFKNLMKSNAGYIYREGGRTSQDRC